MLTPRRHARRECVSHYREVRGSGAAGGTPQGAAREFAMVWLRPGVLWFTNRGACQPGGVCRLIVRSCIFGVLGGFHPSSRLRWRVR